MSIVATCIAGVSRSYCCVRLPIWATYFSPPLRSFDDRRLSCGVSVGSARATVESTVASRATACVTAAARAAFGSGAGVGAGCGGGGAAAGGATAGVGTGAGVAATGAMEGVDVETVLLFLMVRMMDGSPRKRGGALA